MRPYQPAVAALALAALVPLAGAADAATPAAGTATSTATLATLTAVGKRVDVAKITATAGNVSGLLAKISVAPLAVDGADVVPAVTVEPDGSPVTVPSVSTPAALAPVVSVSSPSLLLNAASGAAGQTSGLSTPSGLGSLSVLGLDLSIDGSLSVGSLVDAGKSDASKSLQISDVALPSVADLLSSLGLDLAKLPADTLQALVAELGLAIDAAQATLSDAVDDAQAALAALATQMDGLEDELADAEAAATAAATAATAANQAFQQALTDAGLDQTTWDALIETVQQSYSDVYAADGASAGAATAAAVAADAVDDAQDAIDLLQTTIDDAIDALQDAVSALVPVVAGLLDVPLVSLASAKVGTVARVDSAKTADVVGEVSGLEIIGTDVLDLATGASTIDVAKTVDDVVAEINGEIAGVLGTLSSVLEDVAGIRFPAPVVKLLQKTTATGTDGAFGTADVSVSVLEISIPPVSLPENVVLDAVLDSAGSLADNLDLVDGVLAATGFGLEVGTLSEAARFRPAALTPGTTPAPGSTPRPGSLPTTGAPFGLALLAAAGVAGAVVLRRSALARAEG